MASCKSCEAPIIWATSLTTGKAMPLDEQPTKDGNMTLLPGGKARGRIDEDERLKRPRYVSHFVTCPDRADWRRR